MDNNKKILWIFVILIVSFALGVAGMLIYQKNRYKDTYFEYNGYTIHKVTDKSGNNVYQTQIFVGKDARPYYITTRFSPNELEYINVNNYNLNSNLFKKEIYITMGPSSTAVSVLAATEISKITGNFFIFNVPTHGALTSSVEGKNVTVKTCNDVSTDQSIIYLKQTNESKIYSKKGCIILEGKDEYDLIKVANKLILTLLGVIKE